MVTLDQQLQAQESTMLNEDFLVLIESHVPFFRSHAETKYIDIEPVIGQHFKGDFYGLLNSLAVDKKYHYLVLRMNGLLASSDYTGEDLQIMMPAYNRVDRIYANYNTKYG